MINTDRYDEKVYKKQELLRQYLLALDSVAVGFSGGIDSTFLLKTAHEVLKDKAVAVTVYFSSFPQRELNAAIDFCKKEGIKHIVREIDQLEIKGFQENPPDRCYLCKKEFFGTIKELAQEHSIRNVAEGSNMDDLKDYRPGLRAVEELGIKSPLRQAGLTKRDIRYLAKQMNIPIWNKPSSACLASRFVYGETITKEKLHMVEMGEQILQDLGFEQTRVRIHKTMARIEVLPRELELVLKSGTREVILEKFLNLGFSNVTLDLQGYRVGSMNELL